MKIDKSYPIPPTSLIKLIEFDGRQLYIQAFKLEGYRNHDTMTVIKRALINIENESYNITFYQSKQGKIYLKVINVKSKQSYQAQLSDSLTSKDSSEMLALIDEWVIPRI